MNPIDEAILEGLLESRIYAIQSNRFLIDGLHRRPFWTEQKFGETWKIAQLYHRYFGLYRLRHVRSAWALTLDPHAELDAFCVSARCEQYLQYELQKNMTE